MEDLTEHLIRKITTKSKHNRNKDFNVLVDGGFNRTPYQENYYQN